MSGIDDNMRLFYCPQYLDEPTKKFGMTNDELVLFTAGFVVSLMFLHGIVLLLSVIACGFVIKYYKKIKGNGGLYTIYRLLYWFTPPGFTNVKCAPNSSMRLFVGG